MLCTLQGRLSFYKCLKNVFFLAAILSSCTIPRKYQKGKPFLYSNSIDIKEDKFTTDERIAIKQRLLAQLNDSAKVNVKDVFFFLHFIDNPPAYDTGYSLLSAKSMRASMLHMGYYKAAVSFKADTVRKHTQQRVSVHYTVVPGIPTLIDTVTYTLDKSELQQLALKTKSQSYLVAGNPISKTDVLSETERLVSLYRNNGYYKFTSDDIKVIGDTTIEALTNVSDDPFENLKLLADANEKRNHPTIKLAITLNENADSGHLKKYYINNIYIYPDNTAENETSDTAYTEKNYKGYIIRYHNKLLKNSFLARNIYFKKGDTYSQDSYAKTLNSLSNAGVWQSVNMEATEPSDTSQKIDMVIQLLPAKKYAFEASGEASYSTNGGSNVAAITTTGNLLGLAADLSLQNRNVRKEGIKMTNTLHSGVELNLNATKDGEGILNSNEIGLTNIISFPHIVFPFMPFIRHWTSNAETKQSFINTSLSYVDRINLFNLENVSLAMGWQWGNGSKNYLLKPLNIEFSFLYNQSDSFTTILNQNPYLLYSFNTALVIGSAFGYSSTYINSKHVNRQRNFKLNAEESGYPLFVIPLGPLGVFKNYIRQFVKTDVEYTYSVSYPKSAMVFHLFGGIGAPISSNDLTLPFFKQYYSGGSNSMRGWPIRGIGIGGQALPSYDAANSDTTFIDRTGDIKFEGNIEYRYNIVQIIPNTLTLKGALFIDVGNIWDFKNTTPGQNADSLQFSVSNFYKQLGVDIGTGFRFDFNYFLIRFDMGFRIKRPDILADDGWQFPNITFANLFSRGVNDENRRWRYDNFNFTIGIGYPF